MIPTAARSHSPLRPQPRNDDTASTWPVLMGLALLLSSSSALAMPTGAMPVPGPRRKPPVLGSSSQSRGLQLNDVYLAPAGQAAAEGSVTDDVLVSVTIDAGPADRLLSVTVAGHGARPIDRTGRQAGSGLPVSAWAPISAQPGSGRPHVRVTLAPAQARTGSLVPVTFQFAIRGAVTTSAPVWPAANWPNAAQAGAGATSRA